MSLFLNSALLATHMRSYVLVYMQLPCMHVCSQVWKKKSLLMINERKEEEEEKKREGEEKLWQFVFIRMLAAGRSTLL